MTDNNDGRGCTYLDKTEGKKYCFAEKCLKRVLKPCPPPRQEEPHVRVHYGWVGVGDTRVGERSLSDHQPVFATISPVC